MTEARQHQGGCHCGAVRYRVTTDMAQLIECNCSHCKKKGFLLTFVTPDQFDLEKGADKLTEYRFNTGAIRHLFCQVCGVESFAEGIRPDGQPMKAINVRCLDDIDLAALSPMPFDGASR
jgi:hypothetical protein